MGDLTSVTFSQPDSKKLRAGGIFSSPTPSEIEIVRNVTNDVYCSKFLTATRSLCRISFYI
jgi:hypothetical protein